MNGSLAPRRLLLQRTGLGRARALHRTCKIALSSSLVLFVIMIANQHEILVRPDVSSQITRQDPSMWNPSVVMSVGQRRSDHSVYDSLSLLDGQCCTWFRHGLPSGWHYHSSRQQFSHGSANGSVFIHHKIGFWGHNACWLILQRIFILIVNKFRLSSGPSQPAESFEMSQ